MSRKIFKKNSKKIKEQALAQLRETRARLNAEHPGLVERMEEQARKMDVASVMVPPQTQETTKTKQPVPSEIPSKKAEDRKEAPKKTFGEILKQADQEILKEALKEEDDERYEMVDRAHNLHTVLKFLQKTKSSHVRKALKDIVTKVTH